MTSDAVSPGGIYRLGFPFQAPAPGQARPALALSAPDVAGEVRWLPITAMAPDATEPSYALSAADYRGTSLPRPGFIRLDRPLTLPAHLAQKPVAQLTDAALAAILRRLTTLTIPAFAAVAHRARPFVPGETPIPAAGKVVGVSEIGLMVDAALDAWLTTGRFNDAFEQGLARFLGVKHLITVNSGSSANLIAFNTLTSPKLGDRAIRPGDEVISVAAGFPTTVNPILQFGAVPVFVDVELGTYNIDASRLAEAIGPRTKAVMLAHTLGNPFNLDVVTRLCRDHGLWLIEDCCDALGTTYNGQLVGTFGDIGTLSFYPAHHITMGEGGAVFTNSGVLKPIAESLRDWGRDCFCAPGKDNTCKKRFSWQLGTLPAGYDHKYTYSHAGYNLKITDMQAACGLAQLERLPGFIAQRRANFAYLSERLAPCADRLLLPKATPNSDPSWFGFPITLRPGTGVARVDLLRHLDAYKVGTRLLFGGNLTRQPYFQGLRYRVIGDLANTDRVMHDTFWIGVWPGLTESMLDYAAEQIEACLGAPART